MKRKLMNLFIGLVIGMVISLTVINYLNPVEETVIEDNLENNEVFIICDVLDVNFETEEFDVLMQNGEVQTYSASDLPLEFSLVCFKTNNIEDFTSYEVVALR